MTQNTVKKIFCGIRKEKLNFLENGCPAAIRIKLTEFEKMNIMLTVKYGGGI